MIDVYCLEEYGTVYKFLADSPEDAMNNMLYTLNVSHTDPNARVYETKYGYALKHRDKTYWAMKV